MNQVLKKILLLSITSAMLVACGGGTATDSESAHPKHIRKNVESKNIHFKPSGDITSKTPFFLWPATKGAVTYQIGHQDTVVEDWVEYNFTAKQADCSEGNLCSYKPDDSIDVGNERVWWVRANINNQWLKWSTAHAFKVVVDNAPFTPTWQNNALLKSQSGTVTAEFVATPSANNMDGVIGFSKGNASAYTDLGIIVRFSESGIIDARNADKYKASTKISYEAGREYRFKLEINFVKHRYTVYVTPTGGKRVLVGKDFSFRTEQRGMNYIDTMVAYTVAGNIIINDPVFTQKESPVDKIAPVIRLKGSSIVNLIQGSSYKDAGVTATDNKDGNVTSKVKRTGSVSTSKVGTYTHKYNVSDTAGNKAKEVTRTVRVKAKKPPLPPVGKWQNKSFGSKSGFFVTEFVAIPSANNIDGVIGFSKGSANKYADLGLIVRFDKSGDIDARNGGNYQAATSVSYKAGKKYKFSLNIDFIHHSYTIYVTPQGGNKVLLGKDFGFRTEQKSISSINTIAGYTEGGYIKVSNPIFIAKPVIYLNGSSALRIKRGTKYTDKGVVAKDSKNNDITSKVKRTGSVSTSKIGTYYLKYNVTDAAGNKAEEVKRTIEVFKPSSGKLIFQEDFEGKTNWKYDNKEGLWLSEDWKRTAWITDEKRPPKSTPKIETTTSRTGNKSISFYAKKNGNKYQRTEIIHQQNGTDAKLYHGKEYWIGFSVKLPATWENDVDGKAGEESLFQLHDTGKNGSPPLSLHIRGNKWYWDIRSSTSGEYRCFSSSPTITKGAWVDFVIHTKLSEYNDGFLEVWRTVGGKKAKIVDYTGPNAYADDHKDDIGGKYVRGIQVGIYKWPWVNNGGIGSKVTERKFYMDSIKLSEGGVYEDVAPSMSDIEDVDTKVTTCKPQ